MDNVWNPPHIHSRGVLSPAPRNNQAYLNTPSRSGHPTDRAFYRGLSSPRSSFRDVTVAAERSQSLGRNPLCFRLMCLLNESRARFISSLEYTTNELLLAYNPRRLIYSRCDRFVSSTLFYRRFDSDKETILSESSGISRGENI